MSPILLIRASIVSAVRLYFEPITRWGRSRHEAYLELAARQFLLTLHDLATRLTVEIPQTEVNVVRQSLRDAETALASDVASVVNLSQLGNLLSASSRVDGAWEKTTIHAAFVAGYIAGLLKDEPAPTRYVNTAGNFYRVNDELTSIVKNLRFPPLAKSDAA